MPKVLDLTAFREKNNDVFFIMGSRTFFLFVRNMAGLSEPFV